MKKPEALKTSWTWKEWQAGRAARKAVADRVGPAETRRRESSSDKRLKPAFKGKRGPDWDKKTAA